MLLYDADYDPIAQETTMIHKMQSDLNPILMAAVYMRDEMTRITSQMPDALPISSATRVSFFGNDLGEATREAMEHGRSKASTHYISPYRDPTVAAGAGTAVVEAYEDAGPFDHVVVPLGGGGLAAAVAAWYSEHAGPTQITCVHHQVFDRSFDSSSTKSTRLSTQLRRPVEASYCDGLAVQLVQETPLATVLDSLIDHVVQVSEDEVAIAIAQVIRCQSLSLEGSAAAAIAAHTAIATPQPSLEPRAILTLLASRLLESVDATMHRFEQTRLLSDRLKLRTDAWSYFIVDTLFGHVRPLAVEFAQQVADNTLAFWMVEERYRILVQLLSAASCMFDRASPSYDQAVTSWFSDTASQNSTMVNYDRYGAIQLRSTEVMVLQALRPAVDAPQPVSLLLASSGMAAFQILLHFFSFASTGLFHLSHANGFDSATLISAAEKCDARVVFLDPVANMAGLPITDVRDFAKKVSLRPGWEKRTVIIDGTMISGGLLIYDWFIGPHAPLALYSESASKYPQWSLDIQIAGFVIFPGELDEEMRRIRRNLGSVMYSRGVSLFTPSDFTHYQSRMAMLTQNSETLCRHLVQTLADVATVDFPMAWSKLGWRHGGSIITIEFLQKGLNSKEGLDACIELVIAKAREQSLPIKIASRLAITPKSITLAAHSSIYPSTSQ
ncbi:hypothetical protein J1614_004304 [Plenodomus biglobosus]|nr:hypothetical protein J1614_004304 [Plenodomus biglobosus]